MRSRAVLSRPRAGEVRVRVHACGICHTDLAVKLQHIPIPLPKVLGHEGAGIVEEVGPGTTHVRPGDHVLMSFGSCGECGNCRDGALGYCDHFRPINLYGHRAGGSALSRDGKELGGHFFAQSAFATHAIASVRNIVKVDDDLPLELLAPLGCGIQTGMGSVMNVLRPQAGTSIAVFGVGAVGLSAIIAARIVGCSTIIAVDVVPERLRVAQQLGATGVVSGRGEDPVAEIVDLTQGGANSLWIQRGCRRRWRTRSIAFAHGVSARRSRRRLAGPSTPPKQVSLSVAESPFAALSRETQTLNCSFREEFFREGRLPLDKIVKIYALEKINEAVDDLEHGRVVKPVLTMRGFGSAA